MNNTILINPKTGQEYDDVPPTVAAKYLGVALNFIYEGLKKQKLPIGSALQSDSGRWTYNIPCARLKAYAHGTDIIQTASMIKKLFAGAERSA
ncbi:hypothetical protein [Ruminococcus sp. YE282]|uniref:hypothetical protein n=1 Tax=Ruminococcus sp. YE282 TaxID=3158780 RepID=UPI00088DC019|nr:hypothetical protein SAMN02910441_00684 [Ruminococcus bromii]